MEEIYKTLKARKMCRSIAAFERDWLNSCENYYFIVKTHGVTVLLSLYFNLKDADQADLAAKVYADLRAKNNERKLKKGVE